MDDDRPIAGQSFTLNVTVRNQGSGPSGDSTLTYYQSSDSTLSSDDLEVGALLIPALDASESSDESITLTAPSISGTYHYGVCVDPVSGESDTTNNCSDAVVITVIPPPPDLSVDGLTVDDDGPMAEQPFTLSATVRNLGIGSSSTTTLRYYRSADSTITPDDEEEGSVQASALDASGSSDGTITLGAPSTPGAYYYGACVDPVSGESDKANNCSVAVVVNVPPKPWPTYVAATTTAWPPLPPVKVDIGVAKARSDQLHERWVRGDLDRLKEATPELATKIGDLPWIADGIESRAEFYAARGVISLAEAGYADNLLEHSWVIDAANLPALQSLWYLRRDVEKLTKIMTHPNFSDGVNKQEAKILATLHPVSDPELLEKLLEAELVAFEERTIILPLAGEIELTIIRDSAKIDYAMDSLELAVRNIEEFMGLPLPIRNVIVWFDNVLEKRGVNYATYFSVSVKELNKSRESAIALLAHEAGHYYWRALPRWRSEGAAHILASVASDSLQDRLISTNCGQTQSIVEFERFTSSSSRVHDCDYSLGERLFRDLHRNVDETAFRLAFRRLYLHTLIDDLDECGNDTPSICFVREAFTYYVSEVAAPAVERVIERWYNVPEARDLSWIENTPVTPEIAAIDGRIEEAYLSITPDGPPVSVVPVGPNRNPVVHLNLDYSYENTDDLRNLPIDVNIYKENSSELTRLETDLSLLPLPSGLTRHSHALPIPFWGETGRYWVQIHTGGQKIAKATFEAVPEPDPHKMRGLVTDTKGQALEEVAIQMTNKEGTYWTESGSDGTFEAELPSGKYSLELLLLVENHFLFVGWYDGKGGITIDPAKAFKVAVEDADIEGIDIVLSADTESLLCPSGGYRSEETGRCPS